MVARFFYPEADEIFSDKREVARYMGYRVDSLKKGEVCAELEDLIDASIREMRTVLMPKAVYGDFEIIRPESEKMSDEDSVSSGRFYIAGFEINSTTLFRNLKNCSRAIILASTIGSKVDLLIRRSQLRGSIESAVMQAVGAMFIESLTDFLNDTVKKEWAEKGFRCHPRFSPGYGDLSLSIQKNIFSVLPCTKIGLTLMDTLVMAPEKSVTAFIGVEI